ncbi:MAG: sodium/solute symporter [Verrucomicrobia bacterium]|nr:sodium/solute symporter [Verrucomicrobiota bacterium]
MARFGWLDYLIFGAYLAATVGLGVAFTRKQRNIQDYFLAGRSMGRVVVAISVLAALFSGITYLGAPGEVYAHGMAFVLFALSFFIATPVTTVVVVPVFFRRRIYTAYAYLEERFSLPVRLLSSALFIVRVLVWLSLATYAPALALEQVTGLPLWFTILCTGLLTTAYTTLGGMKAVIWTDVMQFVVLFGGQLLILAIAVQQVPGGLGGVYDVSRAAGKLDLSLSLDPRVRVTLWGLLLGGAAINLVQMATDQVSVQRYLTATSLREAQRSLWLKLWLLMPVMAVFYVTGLVIWAFYQAKGDPLAAGAISRADQILPYFVVNELSVGLPGLLIAAIYAASMSTTSAGINALTTATLVDFHQRVWRRSTNADDLSLGLARWLTVGYGVLVIALAFVVSKLGTLLEASNKAIGLVGGPLLGLFLLGILSRRATPVGAVAGWVAGVVALVPVCFQTRVSFLWYGVVGCAITVAVGWGISRLLPPRSSGPEAVRGNRSRSPHGTVEPG